MAFFEILDRECIGEYGFFFEIAYETMAGARGKEVAEEERVEEDALGAEDHGAHEEAGFVHFEEGEEVHAFVVCYNFITLAIVQLFKKLQITKRYTYLPQATSQSNHYLSSNP